MTDGFRLVMTQGPEPGRTFSLERDVVSLGRDPGNDIAINHPQVSRQHARLTRRGGVMVLEDLGSTNGTFVNGVRLTGPHTLAGGDVIGLGDAVTFTFYGQPAGEAPTVMTGPRVVTPPPPPPAQPPFPTPPSAYAPPVAPETPVPRPKKRRTGLWIGCGCGVLLATAVLIAVLYFMDLYYPDILYAPLRWLGF